MLPLLSLPPPPPPATPLRLSLFLSETDFFGEARNVVVQIHKVFPVLLNNDFLHFRSMISISSVLRLKIRSLIQIYRDVCHEKLDVQGIYSVTKNALSV